MINPTRDKNTVIQQEARLKGREAGLTWCLCRDKTLARWYFSDIKFQKVGNGEVEDHIRYVQGCWSYVHCGPLTRFTSRRLAFLWSSLYSE